MTRIDEAAEVIAKHTEVLGASRMRQYDKAILAARTLDDEGHLLPDLPKPDEHGEWSIDALVVRIDGINKHVCIEDVDPYEGQEVFMFPDEAREVAYALLAAAAYAEEHANDQ
jgi:hypothetical protein